MYRKRLYVFFDGDRSVHAIVRNYTADDFDDLIRIQQISFPPPFPSELWWNKEQLASHVQHCPQGALCVELDGVVAGSITGLSFSSMRTSRSIRGRRSPTAAISAIITRTGILCMLLTFAWSLPIVSLALPN